MHLSARLRLELARRPWIYWLAVATLAALVALGVAHAMAGIDATRRAWGEQVAVWVATADIEPGQSVAARRTTMPRAAVPVDVATGDPTRSVARQRIATGAIITTIDVAVPGPAGLIPDGWVAIAVPVPAGHFADGDRVTVFAADRSLGDGVVVDRTDADVMVAVPAAIAGDLAASVLAGSVVLALAP